MIIYFKWTSWFIIFILSFHIYKHSKIRFSYSHHTIYYYIAISILFFNIMFCHLLNTLYPLHHIHYWYYILLIFGLIAINIIYHTPIPTDNSFKPPPSFINKSNKYTYILILTLISFNILAEYYNLKFFNITHKLLFSSFIINLILFSYLFHNHIHFTTCKYNLPQTWG